MRSLNFLLMVLIAGLLSACQIKPESTAPVRLSAEEVRELFVDKTVESFNLISGTTSFTYYAPNGSVDQERYWQKRKGQWQVNEQGEICLAMADKPYSCRGVYREGRNYYKYRLDAQGQMEKIIRYRQFIEGKAI